MRTLWYLVVITVLSCCMVVGSALAADMASVPKISKEKLKATLHKPNVVVVDVRVAPDWDDSGFKIKGAVREDPRTVENWFTTLPKKKTLVFYCA